jgi:cysteinyl-tRNA synthetase
MQNKMSKMRVYNTYTHQKEQFVPSHGNEVSFYSCGPTVYDYAHIGNMRAFVFADVLKSVLQMNGFEVKHVMNITDVGHLVSDADDGEDKVEMQSRKQNRSAWDLVEQYSNQFLADTDKLNLARPTFLPKATDHISEQVALIKQLEDKGYTYKASDGIYFDTTKFAEYGVMANLAKQELKPGARVKMSEGKKNPTDFALWKFSPKDEKRQMEWDSPWGKGFPGWHIECSAMAMKYLGETIDIHTGGVDHVKVHHTNEIAQSEAATEHQFVRYWMHSEFLLLEGQKMSKSLGNIVTVSDLETKGYDSLSYRYLLMTSKYRSLLNFTWSGLKSAQKTLKNIRVKLATYPDGGDYIVVELERFEDALNDDLDTPTALAILHGVLKGEYSDADKKATILKFDQVLKLDLAAVAEIDNGDQEIPSELTEILSQRNLYRSNKMWKEADEVRGKIEEKGYEVLDLPEGPSLRKKT